MGATLTDRRPRTHMLSIDVPIHIDPDDPPFDYDPIYEVLRVVLSVSRMALDGVVCDDIAIHLDAA